MNERASGAAVELRFYAELNHLCNTPLDDVDKVEVQAQLPARTAACFDVFWRCPNCRRVYWRGSHWRRLCGAIEAVSSVP